MLSSLLPSILLSFTIGMISVSTLSITAERSGSTLAGALGGFPATLAATLLFLALAQGPWAAVSATTVIPATMGIYAVSLSVYHVLIHRNLLLACVASVASWTVATGLLAWSQMSDINNSLLIGLLLGVCSVCLLRFFSFTSSQEQDKGLKLSSSYIIARSITGGVLGALTFYLAAVAGPFWGGIMSGLPAITLSTMIVTYQLRGPSFSAEVTRSLLFSGVIGVTTYALAVRILYPRVGVIVGTLGGFCAVALVGLAVLFLRPQCSVGRDENHAV